MVILPFSFIYFQAYDSGRVVLLFTFIWLKQDLLWEISAAALTIICPNSTTKRGTVIAKFFAKEHGPTILTKVRTQTS